MPKIKDNGLSIKQKAFVLYYLKYKDATKAAIEAGYSKKTAYSIGHENLNKPEIKKLIENEFKELGYAVQVALLKTLNIMQSNMDDYVIVDEGNQLIQKPFKDLTRDQKACIKKIENDRIIKENADGSQVVVHDKIKYELYDVQKSINDTLRIAGKFTDKIDITSGGEKIEPIKFVIVKKEKKK